MHVTIYKTKSLRPASSKYNSESEYFRTSRGGYPPVPTKKLFAFAQNPWVALAEAGWSGHPDPAASYAPDRPIAACVLNHVTSSTTSAAEIGRGH